MAQLLQLHSLRKRLGYKQTKYATVAQSVEQLIRNQQVAGSSPASSSIKIRESEMAPVFFWRSAESRPGRRSPWTRSADMIVLSIALDLATIAVPSHLRLAGRRSFRCAPYESGHNKSGAPNLAPGEGRPGRDRQT